MMWSQEVLYCATCHQEHQGVCFNLSRISNEKCVSCHVVRFRSFDHHHPKFENYPFKRRTRIVYDHAGHFGKHFPEVAKKYPARRIPDTCSTCHDSRNDKRVMAVAPFEQTCTTCHLDQIVGKERASGPKGIAFLTLPGLDVQTLKEKNAAIGEWPDASEAELTPFMKVMISRDERGRALIKTVDSLNLQDLSDASDDQIKAVTNLVWEIKRLFYALISGKASDVLADLNIGSGVKLSANLVADLTASIPRDVVISAQQQWLPNLATEMAKARKRAIGTRRLEHGDYVAGTASSEEPSGADAREADPDPSTEAEISETASTAKLDPPVCAVRAFLVSVWCSRDRRMKLKRPRLKQPSPKEAGTDATQPRRQAPRRKAGSRARRLRPRRPRKRAAPPIEQRCAQPSRKERPEIPMPRTQARWRQGNAPGRRTTSGQGGGPNRRSALPHEEERRAIEAITSTPRKQPSLRSGRRCPGGLRYGGG